MKYEQYVSLIQKLEVSAARSRRIYELKVLALGLLGYAYMIGLIVLLLLIPVCILLIFLIDPETIGRVLLWTVKLWWAVLPGVAIYFGFIGGAVKALFAKMPEPEGRVLEKDEAPELHTLVEETCRKLKAVQPRRIFVTDEFNASVVTVPRFGIFGSKVYMFIGLPVLTALSPEQFKAVLAHEIGHISGKHGGYGKWAYQLRGSWGLFIESQELQDHKLASLYQGFVDWFFPYFQAYSFVLMREHEKEADDYAVDLAGSRPLGEALISLHTRTAELEQVYWANIQKENQETSEQPLDIFARMLSALAIVDNGRDLKTLEKAIQIPTDYNDSHPSLADRLKRFGYWNGERVPILPLPVTETAAEHFLGAVREKLVAEFESQWTEQIAKTWKARYEQFQASNERIDALENKAADEKLTPDELLEKAGLLAQKEGNAAVVPLLRQAVEQDPDHPEANYALGSVLLSEDDEKGLDYVKRSMELDVKWKYAASDVAFQYLRSKGRLEEAKPYAETLEGHSAEMQTAERERQVVSVYDKFIPHSYSDEIVETILQKTRYYEEISQIYLVRKDVQYFKEYDFHVLFLKLRSTSMFKNRKDMKPSDLLDSVVRMLSGIDIGFIQIVDSKFNEKVPEFAQIPGALIFDSTREE